jgi:hypothetical protein
MASSGALLRALPTDIIQPDKALHVEVIDSDISHLRFRFADSKHGDILIVSALSIGLRRVFLRKVVPPFTRVAVSTIF